MTPADDLAQKTGDAYSATRYNSWRNVCATLLKRGYTERQAEAILRSKWTRWAADAADANYGEATANDLVRFIEDPRNNCTMAAVNQLVMETF